MQTLIKAAFISLFIPFSLAAIWVWYSYHEARAYHKVTGHSVDVYDAMFLNLRIVNFPKVEQDIIVYEEDYDG